MRYKWFFSLDLTHTYYATGKCPDFEIRVIPATRQLLQNYRCLVRRSTSGLRIFAPVTDKTAFIPWSTHIMLGFQLVLQHSDFMFITDLSNIRPCTRPIPRYANTGTITGAPVLLQPKPYADPAKLLQDEEDTAMSQFPQQYRDIFADIEITYGSSVPTIAEFELQFQAKQSRWKYYVVTDSASDQFQIVDTALEGPLTFTQVQPSSDRIARALAEQYPNTRIVELLSTSMIPCREQPRTLLQLQQGNTPVVRHLPNPSPRNYTEESSLFHVITYFTNYGSTSGG